MLDLSVFCIDILVSNSVDPNKAPRNQVGNCAEMTSHQC